MSARALLAAAVLLVGGTACVAGPTRQQLVDRAAFDLKCDPSQIQITELDSRTRGVTACGQQVTYVNSCQHAPVEFGTKSSACTWVQNTDSSKVKSAKE